MRMTKKKIGAVVAATAVVALGGTAAFAYFTAGGSGGGTATVGTATLWQINVDPVVGGPLLPGVGAQTFAYHVVNTSPATQYLNKVVAAINANGVGDVTGSPGCKAADFTIAISGQPAGPVASGLCNDGNGTITLTETGLDQDPCQNAHPAFTLTAS